MRTYDLAIRDTDITVNYRRDLLKKKLDKSEREFRFVNFSIAITMLNELFSDYHLLSAVKVKLNELKSNLECKMSSRTSQKLNILYNGQIFLPTKTDAYVNLSHSVVPYKLYVNNEYGF